MNSDYSHGSARSSSWASACRMALYASSAAVSQGIPTSVITAAVKWALRCALTEPRQSTAARDIAELV